MKENQVMRKTKPIAFALLASVFLTSCSATEIPQEKMITTSTAASVQSEVLKIRAQDDFYGYINAEYLNNAKIDPKSGAAGSFYDLAGIVDKRLDELIDEIIKGDSNSYKPGSNEQLIRDLYYKVLDASTGGKSMNAEDITYLKDKVAEIRSVKNIDEYLKCCGTLYKEWRVNPIFGGNIDTNLTNSSQGCIQLRPFSSPDGTKLSKIILGGYNAQSMSAAMKRVLVDFGEDPDKAQVRAVNDVRLIMEVAEGTDLDLIELIDNDLEEAMNHAKYLTNDEIDRLCPNVGIKGIVQTMNMDKNPVSGVYLWDKGQLAKLDSLLTDKNLEAWKDIALFSFISSLQSVLPDEYGGSNVLYSNDVYAKQFVKHYLGKEIGEEYTEKYYDEKTVADVTKIAKDLNEEYIVLINKCEWLSDTGKKAIITKLNNMRFFIGADKPHITDPGDKDLIGATIFRTMRNINIRSYNDSIDHLINGNEKNGFEGMLPQTVNACYMPDINSINITLGIMNAPFYSPDNSYWKNLGGIGSVVAHEISHAFDNQGMMFDMNGNYNPGWISDVDREAFDKMASKVKDYYSGVKVLGIHPVDGKLTLAENLADISGVECILNIAKTNEQKREVIEQYARIWACITTKDNALGQLYLDSHSPEIVRVNAVVPLFDCFYEIYGVKEGDGMYVAPEKRVRRW